VILSGPFIYSLREPASNKVLATQERKQALAHACLLLFHSAAAARNKKGNPCLGEIEVKKRTSGRLTYPSHFAAEL
jgi:hypothetical protein